MLGGPEVLAERLARNEPGAEEEFVSRYAARVQAVLRARLHDAEAAREVANDVLLAVLRALDSGRLQEPAKLPAFVMGTARNLANNYCRSRARRPVEGELPADLPAHDGAGPGERRERLLLVFAHLQHFDETDRSILGLTLAQGLKPGEIARALRLPPEVVRARKCRAVRRLAAQLRESAA